MTTTDPRDRIERLLARALPYAPVAIATFWLARTTTREILARAGEPAVPLDDAYIHFQYARSLAEGRFFAFQAGDSYTSGATSLLWPLALAPFYLVGFRDTAIIWAAWFLGWLFLGLLAIEVKRLAERLVGEWPAIAAACATLSFGGYTWFAASGMEVTPLAWVLCLTARLASEWQENIGERPIILRRKLLILAVLAPLVRPEGMVASLMVLATLALFPRGTTNRKEEVRERAFALLALIGPAIPPVINKLLTGHFSTTTTQVKWLAVNPYFGGVHFWPGVKANLEVFVKTLLDGKEWSAIFIPAGALPVAAAAFGSIPYAGYRSKKTWRMLLILGLAIGMAIPTTYLSFLWNRLRYLWPFAFAWCIALACLGRALGDLAALIRTRWAVGATLVPAAGAGLLGHHLTWSMDDVAQSSYAIHNQQVLLGRWAAENLPATARIGLNDTGAIAYFSGRRTFDVVGLTTPEEARYWVSGAGSRFEHYERLHKLRPESLPTHFIVYPNWMACDAVLGRELTRATVLDQSILGGATMIAYEARYDLLHTGDLPEEPVPGELVDELDVSDLESEGAHGFDMLAGGGIDTDNTVHSSLSSFGGKKIVDAGRDRRMHDGFRLSGPNGRSATLALRLFSSLGAHLSVRVDDHEEAIDVPVSTWWEGRINVPPSRGASPRRVDVTSIDGRSFGSMHYWLFAQLVNNQ